MEENRKRRYFLEKSYGVLELILFFIKNQKRYYIPDDFMESLGIKNETWVRSYRRRLLKNGIISKFSGKVEGIDKRKKPFEFNKGAFLNDTFDKIQDVMIATSKRVSTKVDTLKSLNRKKYLEHKRRYKFWTNPKKKLNDRMISLNSDKTVFKEVFSSLDEIDRITGHQFKYIMVEILDNNLLFKLGKGSKGLDKIDRLFQAIKDSVSIKQMECKGIESALYPYFILTIEEIAKNEKGLKRFKDFYHKIIEYWIKDSELRLNQKPPLIPSKMIPTAVTIFHLDKVLE